MIDCLERFSQNYGAQSLHLNSEVFRSYAVFIYAFFFKGACLLIFADQLYMNDKTRGYAAACDHALLDRTHIKFL